MSNVEILLFALAVGMLIILIGAYLMLKDMLRALEVARRNDHRDPVTGRFISVKKKTKR